MEFAENHLQKVLEFWKTFFFADERKYEYLDQMDIIVCVWRKPGEELRKEKKIFVQRSNMVVVACGVRMHGGMKRGNLHFIKGSVTKHVCINIPQGHLKACAEELRIQEHFAFYHDSDPKYSSHLVRGWCLYSCPKVIKSPPQSPDLNVIENLLAKLETEIRNHTIFNKGDLKKALRE